MAIAPVQLSPARVADDDEIDQRPGLLARAVDAVNELPGKVADVVGSGVQALREGDQAMARNINENVFGGVPVLPVPAQPGGTFMPAIPAAAAAEPVPAAPATPPVIEPATDPRPLPPAPARPTGGPAPKRDWQASARKIAAEVEKGSPTPPAPNAEQVAMDARTAAGEAEARAQQGLTDVATAKAEEIAAHETLKADVLKRANVEAEEKRAAGMAYLQKAREEARNFKMKDMFEGKEGSLVAVALMAGLGQFAATRSGGKNGALEQLNAAADRWEARERARYQQLLDSGTMAERDIDLIDAEVKNKKAGLLENLAGMRDGLDARFLGPEAAAKGGVIQAQLRKDAAALQAEAAEKVAKRAFDERELTVKEGLAAAEIKLRGGQTAAAYAQAAESRAGAAARAAAGAAGGVAPDQYVHGPGGKPIGVVADKKVAAEVNQSLAGYRGFMEKASRLRDLVAKHGGELTGDVAGEMNALRTALTLDIKNLEQGGALDEGMVKVVEGMIPDQTGWSGKFLKNNSRAVAQINMALRMADDKIRNRVNAAGLRDEVVDRFGFKLPGGK
jgi:hypothetical protein